jgi:nitrite reductase/ring-hydroxylating ferredoxin subunit
MARSLRICAAADVPADGAKLVSLDRREFAVVAHDGKYYAVENSCPHKGGPLGRGQVKNGTITCPWHRFRFDLETGKSVTNPAMRIAVRRIVVDRGDLLVQEE